MSDDEEIPELFQMLEMLETWETGDNFDRELSLDDIDPPVMKNLKKVHGSAKRFGEF